MSPFLKKLKVVASINNKITNLRNLVKAYGNKKSDVEISTMLDISIDEVNGQRKEILRDSMKTGIEQQRLK
ncbi:hypothetical protein [Natronincola ferrireducens]|uniref:hypothetical protein n=1 Tax=Natronincola ferrireducens TaxID=393762 RepID=UPI000B8229F9|nr:hypothetical protein [Natronincola ferrireducens]